MVGLTEGYLLEHSTHIDLGLRTLYAGTTIKTIVDLWRPVGPFPIRLYYLAVRSVFFSHDIAGQIRLTIFLEVYVAS